MSLVDSSGIPIENYMSHVVRKPVYAICEQQRRRSARASVQSDQCLSCSLPRQCNIFSFYICNFMSLAKQTGLSHTWSKNPKTGFLVTWLISYTEQR